jgi:CspA family cold shock protein
VHLVPEGREGAKTLMQGVVRTYDPQTGEGVVVRDTDRAELILAPEALAGSLFRMLRQGQRINFELDGEDRIIRVRIGAEADLGLPTAQI